MMRLTCCRGPLRWALGLSILAAALTAAACGDVNISPTEPDFSFSSDGVGIRSLQIAGSLTAENGTCLEATVLYDGKELPGSNVLCPDAAGCTAMDLAAVTTSAAGRHTISFKVLNQPLEATVYVAKVTVRVSREGLPFVLPISRGPVRATLRAGESVTFEFNFVD